MAKEPLTDAEQRMIRRILRHGVPLSRRSIAPENVKTCLRLERRGFVLSDRGCFRLSKDGGEQAFLHGIAPHETA